MNASLFDRARAERFAQLLDEADGRRRRHTRSRLDDELAELVAEAQLLRDMPIHAEPDPIFKRDLRAMLVAAAEREFDLADAEPEPKSRFGTRGAVIVGIAAGTLALSGVSMASGSAVPGDPLYGMKRSTEKAQLALAGSDLARGQLFLDFARTRLDEAYKQRANQSQLVDGLAEMDAETQQGVRMLVSTAFAKHDTTALDAIDTFVHGQRDLVGRMLELTRGDARDKVTGSLSLLNSVEQRSVAARSALACGIQPTGSDVLGPTTGVCAVSATSHPGSSSQSTVTGQKNAAGPGQVETPQASASATPAAPAEKKDDGVLGELGRILGSLLGG